ncbi:MAG: hypothetical protein B7Z37_18275 [Verrucomicrobia bacterium 12-59-8]|nr:MAG: hypothetical protein B7Z37_18275 [Verrucomicrobia bacterium 12-59-8]
MLMGGSGTNFSGRLRGACSKVQPVMIVAAWIVLMASVAAVLHCYVGYPLWWRVIGRRRPPLPLPPTQEEPSLPLISVVVVGYNEAGCISRRVENLLQCVYPTERLEIIIASDGSDDGTEQLAALAAGGDARVQVRHFTERRGKVRVLNEVCPQAKGSILVLSDANVDFAPDTFVASWYSDHAKGRLTPSLKAFTGNWKRG